MKESVVSAKLRKELVSLGAVSWKMSDRFHASRPDLLVAYNRITSFIEVKVYPNTTTKLQQVTLNELYNVGVPTYTLTYYPNSKSLIFVYGTGQVGSTPFFNYRQAAQWLLGQHS